MGDYPKKLTAIWKTSDGKFWETEEAAVAYEERRALVRVIEQARRDAQFSDFGREKNMDAFVDRFGELLIKAGVRIDTSK